MRTNMVRVRISPTLAVLSFLLIALSGCGGTPQGSRPPEPRAAKAAAEEGRQQPRGLAETRWRLVEIQSMDDSQGSTRLSNPAEYTMHLRADGTVAMKLGCNSAKGSWKAQPGSSPSSGQFEFGPLAGTRALCPPPRLDETVLQQSSYVRSYLIKDGRLSLSLMADGGIHIWEPEPDSAPQPNIDRELETAILRASPSYRKAMIDIPDGPGKGRYALSRVDLNSDGREEVLVYLMGSIFCGTGGCNLQVFTPGAKGYRLVNDFPITRPPVIVSATRSNGWADLWRMESGGGAPASYVRHTFDGQRYTERARLPADDQPSGRHVLTGDVSFQTGIPLEPRD